MYICGINRCAYSATRKDNLKQHAIRYHQKGVMHADQLRVAIARQEEAAAPTLPSAETVASETPDWMLLMRFASSGNISHLLTLLESGCDLNLVADDGSTALHCAARAGQTDVVRLLLDKSASLNHRNSNGNSPLMEAALGKNPDCILVLLKAGATTSMFEPGRYMSYTKTYFVDLVSQLGNAEVIKSVLQEKATEPEYVRSSKVRALAAAAARAGDTTILELLLESDAEVFENPSNFLQRQDESSISCKRHGPLWYAVLNGHLEATNLLLRPTASYSGANVATLPSRLLRFAARKGYPDVCTVVLRTMTRLYSNEMIAWEFKNALQEAVKNGHLSLFQALVTHENAPLASKNDDSDENIRTAFWRGHLNMIQYLLQRDGILHTDVKHNSTPSRGELCVLLIRTGKLEVNDTGHGYLQDWLRGRSLLYSAVEFNDLQLSKFLLEHQDFNSRTIDESFRWPGKFWDEPKETALDAAQRLGQTAIADLLIAHGATNHHIKPAQSSQEDRQPSVPLDPDSDLDMEEASDLESDIGSDMNAGD